MSEKSASDDEIKLPIKQRLREGNPVELKYYKEQILAAVNATNRPPAKVNLKAPLSQEMLTSLSDWAETFDYVLHYKGKRKRFDDVPNDIRHEGRYANVYTLELYWNTNNS